MNNSQRFELALYGTCERIRSILQNLPKTVKETAEEIRLRKGLPIALTVSGETVFVKADGQICFGFNYDLPKVSQADLEQSFKLLCGSSAYAHGEELRNGFIMMKNGCRAGVFGTLSENGFMKDITSVNIRIAREVFGAANDIVKSYKGGGLLIAGPPGSGKTTVLRDLLRQLSNGTVGKYLRVAVIDSRCELSGGFGGGATYDLGAACDVLVTADRGAGVEIATRTMFPDIIAFDEIGNAKELESVTQSFYSGIAVITTAHIGAVGELMQRDITARLIKSGAISQVALLPKIRGDNIQIISAKELYCAAVV